MLFNHNKLNDIDDVVDDDDHDDDGESDTEVNDDDQLIQLGFIDDESNSQDFSIRNLFHNPDWRDWDGGKVGGQPVWLDPVNLPDTKSMVCQYCEDPLSFLLQIYCPIDEINEAFHRCLYIFCCRKKLCIDKCSIKCLRVQLPRQNPFYSLDPTIPFIEPKKSDFLNNSNKLPNLCQLCGCRAVNVCSRCKYSYYCSRLHQKEHWNDHKIVCSSSQNTTTTTTTLNNSLGSSRCATQLKYLFPEHIIVVEPEELDDSEDLVTVSKSTNIWDDAFTEENSAEGEDDDAKLSQKDYQRALQGEKAAESHDPRYINFLTRISRGGSKQVLRYCRNTISNVTNSNTIISNNVTDSNTTTNELSNNYVKRVDKGRLYLSSNELTKESKEKNDTKRRRSCERCGAPRVFEFQVMPQLLHYLNVDKLTKLSTQIPSQNNIIKNPFSNQSNKDIDWGSIDVFTCSASCGIRNTSTLTYDNDAHIASSRLTNQHSDEFDITCAYQEELIIMQPSISQKCNII